MIPGLLRISVPLHTDPRGWFAETWHEEKLAALGVDSFRPVQANVARSRRGVTRGIHAEPWDKYVTVVNGRAFGAWVDLRAGSGFGTVVHDELTPGTAFLVPRGVGNAYQSLSDDTVYTYLVDDHWRPDASYPGIRPADSTLGIPWPIALRDAVLSDKDLQAPTLAESEPVRGRRTLVLGGRGQLGSALATAFVDADVADRARLDLTDPAAMDTWPWHDYDIILNAAAYTDVDAAETPAGRVACWQLNAALPGDLARRASRVGARLVHFSTDYVFDGRRPVHDEREPLSPLGVYGQAKAAGDVAAATAERHYVLRTSWMVGDGRNFVRTMAELARSGAPVAVVADQVGRLTFADELARATRHLIDVKAPAGVYNCTSSGPELSWAEVARLVFDRCGRDPDDVRAVSTAEYAAGRSLAPRPRHSTLALDKLEATGWQSQEGPTSLERYLSVLEMKA